MKEIMWFSNINDPIQVKVGESIPDRLLPHYRITSVETGRITVPWAAWNQLFDTKEEAEKGLAKRREIHEAYEREQRQEYSDREERRYRFELIGRIYSDPEFRDWLKEEIRKSEE